MADYILESRVWLARARAEVFAFFADPRNLVLLAPPACRLAVVSAPARLEAGAVLDLSLSWLGLPLGMTYDLTSAWRPYSFRSDPVLGVGSRGSEK